MNAVSPFHASTIGSLKLVPVMGDRMSPRLRHGIDAVYYAPSRFLADDMYVLDWGGGVKQITYVQWMGRGRYRLFGECKHYGSDEVSREQLEEMMLGMVVCEIKVRNVEQFRQAIAGEVIG